jgi:hypothetical protein
MGCAPCGRQPYLICQVPDEAINVASVKPQADSLLHESQYEPAQSSLVTLWCAAKSGEYLSLPAGALHITSTIFHFPFARHQYSTTDNCDTTLLHEFHTLLSPSHVYPVHQMSQGMVM